MVRRGKFSFTFEYIILTGFLWQKKLKLITYTKVIEPHEKFIKPKPKKSETCPLLKMLA